MLKHQEIIDKLTIEQKLDLIADASSLKNDDICREYKFLNVKSLKSEDGWGGYPSFNALAKSWNTKLISQVCSKLFQQQKQQGVNLVELPTAKVKASPFSSGLSEDPYLSGALVSEVAEAGNKNSMSVYSDLPLISKEDEDFSDILPNQRAINEYFFLPYKMLEKKRITAISKSSHNLKGKYGEINDITISSVNQTTPKICQRAETEDIIKEVTEENKIFLGANKETLYDAYEKYLKLMQSFKDCEIGLSDVNKACEKGVALSPENIDKAVDSLMDFMDKCNTFVPYQQLQLFNNEYTTDQSDLNVMATEESTVLLKNSLDVLPLKKHTRVCLIGSLCEEENGIKQNFETSARYSDYKLVGYAKGYGSIKDKNDVLIEEAKKLANMSDVIVVCLGYREKEATINTKNKNCRLPANQEALLEKLYALNKKVIILLSGDCPFDMSFDENAQAVMLVPGLKGVQAKSIIEMLFGKANPSGKLINSLYENTEKRFSDIKNYKNSGRNKIGIFYGYRYYDTGNYVVKYPFGFGLSYTRFKYKKLKINNNTVSFVIKNTGRKSGSEIAQIYVGKDNSSVMRPKKELKTFFKVFLRPGEKKKISFDLSQLDVKIYDNGQKKFLLESGEYTIYVCSSVSKTELCAKTKIYGSGIVKDNYKQSEYFQKVGNIKDGKYYLEEPYKLPKYTKQGRLRTMTVLSFIVTFLDTIYLYLYYYKWLPGGLIYFIGIGAVTFVIYISTLILKQRKSVAEKKYALKSKKMKKEKLSKIDPEELNEEIPYEQLFIEEFREEELDFEEESIDEVEQSNDSFVQYVYNPELTTKRICDEFVLFLKERGVLIDVESVRSLFSAMSSSRMLFLNCENKDVKVDFTALLSEYFNCSKVVGNFDNMHLHGDDIITANEDGITPIASALMEQNAENDNKIRLMTVENVKVEGIGESVSQIFRYLDQPTAENSFYIKTASAQGHYKIPENVWFVYILADGEKANEIPRYLLEVSTVVNLVLREAEQPKVQKVVEPKIEVQPEQTETQEKAVEEQSTDASQTDQTEQIEQAVSLAESQETQTKQEEVKEEQVVEQIEIEKTPVEIVEYYQFEKLLDYACRDFQLGENLWKRLDKLEEYVQTLDQSFKINNKVWLRLEKYVSMYLSVGGVEEAALDSVIAHQVMNTMIPSIVNGKSKGEKLTVTIENIFGEGHIPHTIKTVKSTGLKI